MPLLNRKRVILAKVESVYGTDPSPAATDAVLCRNITITPLEGDVIAAILILAAFYQPIVIIFHEIAIYCADRGQNENC